MAHADAVIHELSGFGASTDLRNTQRALALERFSERSAAAGQGPPEQGPSSLALVPRRGAAASRDQFGLVSQVAGSDSSADSHCDERAQSGTDFAGLSGFDNASFPDDPTWGYFPSHDVLATQGRGLSSC